MTYEEISEYLMAPFIYADVTQEEYDALMVSHFVAYIHGIRILGTNVSIEALESKLVPQPEAAQ